MPDSALRLDMRRALGTLAAQALLPPLGFHEGGNGPEGESGQITLSPDELIENIGDVVLARRTMAVRITCQS